MGIVLTIPEPSPRRKRLVPSGVQFKALRKSEVPPNGWAMEDLNTRNGRLLELDVVNVARFASGRGIASLTPELNRLFVEQIEEVVELMQRLTGQRGFINMTEQGEEYLWGQIIEQTSRAHNGRVSLLLRPKIQSVSSEVFEKIANLIGFTPTQSHRTSINDRVRKALLRAVKLTETTRKKMVKEAVKILKDGAGPAEFGNRLRAAAVGRVTTIARTEMGRAVDEGAKLAYVGSGIVTKVSVKGCKSVEPGIPTLRGVPTCNIKAVDIGDIDLLEFHIQHTGTIVPSGFFKRDGTV